MARAWLARCLALAALCFAVVEKDLPADAAERDLPADAVRYYRWDADRKIHAATEAALRAFPKRKHAGKHVQAALGGAGSSAVVLLFGLLFVQPAFLDSKRNVGFATMLASVLSNATLPNVLLLHSASGGGCFRDAEGAWLPTTVIAKRAVSKRRAGHPPADCGILVPNPYFGDVLHSWKQRLFDLDRAAKRSPQKRRDPRVFWRGRLAHHVARGPKSKKGAGGQADCVAEAGNYARLEAAALSLKRPDLFDVKCTDPCCCAAQQSNCGSYDAEMRKIASEPTLARGNGSSPLDAVKFRYVLNLPILADGSPSPNLNHLWALRAVVLLWTASYTEWYSPALQAGETHVEVNRSNAVRVIADLNTDEEKRNELVQGALRVRHTMLCPDCIVGFFLHLVGRIRSRFGFDAVLDNPQQALDLLRPNNCSGLVQIDFGLKPSGPVRLGRSACDFLDELVAKREAWLNQPADDTGALQGFIPG